MIFVAKKMAVQNIFSPSSFGADFGSEIWDPGWIKIRIREKHPGSATLIILLRILYRPMAIMLIRMLNSLGIRIQKIRTLTVPLDPWYRSSPIFLI
jgi:hypothetical protein